jgi:ABC-type sugar transport system substrate-binding protein
LFREQFPVAEDDSAVVDAQDPPSLLVSLPTLSNGFIGQVASGTDQEAPANPILQVFSCEIIY